MELSRTRSLVESGQVKQIAASLHCKRAAALFADGSLLVLSRRGVVYETGASSFFKLASSSSTSRACLAWDFYGEQQFAMALGGEEVVLVSGQRAELLDGWRLPEGATVHALAWPGKSFAGAVAAADDGGVWLLRPNRDALQLYAQDSAAIALAVKADGEALMSAHADGNIYLFSRSAGGGSDGDAGFVSSLFVRHTVAPKLLAWGDDFVAACGKDAMLTFYSADGAVIEDGLDCEGDPPLSLAALPTLDGVSASTASSLLIFGNDSGGWLEEMQAPVPAATHAWLDERHILLAAASEDGGILLADIDDDRDSMPPALRKGKRRSLGEEGKDEHEHAADSPADDLVVSMRDMSIAEGDQRTLIVFPYECLAHDTGDHQECIERLQVLCGERGILRRPEFSDVEWLEGSDLPLAPLADILRVHEYDYYVYLRDRYTALAAEEGLDGGDEPLLLDTDTRLSPGSFAAALHAVGAVTAAVDRVVSGENKNAFVAVRPPGHHAGPRGAVTSKFYHVSPLSCSSGFCLFNNVAIGAAYARHMYGREGGSVRNIAILDFDIHHGNGTEAVLRNLLPHKEKLPLPGSWAPIEYDSYKPWLDEEDAKHVFFASIHRYDGEEFYPGSGALDESCDMPIMMNLPMPAIASGRGKKAQREARAEGQRTFRRLVKERLMPAMTEFAPDLIFISAGFDGHHEDMYYFLSSEDYSWFTSTVMSLTERVVSVLEGGYHVAGVKKPKRKGSKSAAAAVEDCGLARAAASHVLALCGRA
eukprot:PLAT13216.1.p1 GENE.PLAT13216.1~~PLAT13216.1.p1  ORF type:complete len:762 (+),score=345.15 PLAT13216.1:1-2286(+)